ncbi:hypothetical protein L6164_013224 [Bauhinia variegata]|uniref:Uncharacterized protein n=1 Tax=Bauhinia variegata TaxID=167791 RepID=A0ACB9PCR9_BAUVA|nr:hypothetical protein L6164_013224 [Bauhinia variegata]
MMFVIYILDAPSLPLPKRSSPRLLAFQRDDGFRMNQVLVSLWYIMGLWPLVYGMLLLPTGRSARSKIPAWLFLTTLVARVAIIIYAGLATGAGWTEFFQYFRERKFIHIMSLDFSLLSAFAPFWVYNDMTTRKW